MGNKNQKLNLNREDLYDMYAVQGMSTIAIGKELHCSDVTVSNYLKRFDIPRRSFSEAVSLQAKNRSPEEWALKAKRYRETYYSHSQEELDAINESRKTKPENKELQGQRIAAAHRKSGGCKSKAEDEFYAKLKVVFPDVIRQYYDEINYPFNCDFYIPSKNVFIEYQGHQSHGPEPFNNSVEHLAILNEACIDMTTWTKRDPRKLRCALDNGIKLILIYPESKKNFIIADGKMTTLEISDFWKI